MGTNEQLKEERDKIVKGLEETYRKLIEFKKFKKNSQNEKWQKSYVDNDFNNTFHKSLVKKLMIIMCSANSF